MLTTEQINKMTPEEIKVEENRLRRAAKRQGLVLNKSRARDPRALGYGMYLLSDQQNRVVVHNGQGRGVSLRYIDWYLCGPEGSVYQHDGADAQHTYEGDAA